MAIFYDYKFYFVYDLIINEVRKWPFAWGFLQNNWVQNPF